MGVNYDALALAALPMCIGLYTFVILAQSYVFDKYRLWKEKTADRPADVDLTFAIWAGAIVSSALSLLYGWGFLSAFRTTLQAMSALHQPIDCSSVSLTTVKVNGSSESFIPFKYLVGTIQITPLNFTIPDNNNGTFNATLYCGSYLAANTTSTDFTNFNNLFSYGLIPLFNYCGTDLWETYSGAGVLNPNFATIIGAPIGAFGMFKGGIKKIFPRHVRNMDWSMMDIAGSRHRFLSYKLWTRHYTQIDPTREFEGNYFRKEKTGGWKWAGSRTLEGFTNRPHGEYMHGSSDDLMHLGPNETVVTNYTVSTFNAMLFRNGISSLVRSAIAINITIIPILVVRQLQDRETVVDDTSYLVMQMWIGLALGYSAASVLAGWYAFSIWQTATLKSASPDQQNDKHTETLFTYNQTGAERYRMGTYYCLGQARFQNGFHQMPFQCAAFVQGVTSVLLSALSALTLVSLQNAIIWIITHGEWNRGLQTCLWLPSVFVVFYRFLFVLPFAREVDDKPSDGSPVSNWRRVFYTPFYNWLARLPQLSDQRYLTSIVYDCIGLRRPSEARTSSHQDRTKWVEGCMRWLRRPRDTGDQRPDCDVQNTRAVLGTHFLSPMRLSWLENGKAVVKTTLHGGFYRYFPTKMLLEKGDGDALRITFPRVCLMDGDLLRILTKHLVTRTISDSAQTLGKRCHIKSKFTYLVMMFKPNGQTSRLYAMKIPREPWVSKKSYFSTLHIATSFLESAPKDEAERRVKSVTSPCVKKMCVAVQLKDYKCEEVCKNCTVKELEKSFSKKEIDGLHRRYAILYRQHPSKPYALFSRRRSGEVVAREIPGEPPLRSGEKLVCVRNLNGDSPRLKKTTLPFRNSQHLQIFFHSGLEHVDSKIMCSSTTSQVDGNADHPSVIEANNAANNERAARLARKRNGAFAAALAAVSENLDQDTLNSLVNLASKKLHDFTGGGATAPGATGSTQASKWKGTKWKGNKLTVIHMGCE